ncbi:retron St85 family effector protein [Variovorax sp. CAN2819]|uniref:retron St85 family effector protein n=1 Tax=Variovorax sp. CAN15 TaxID=3046727 RepID=UPI0026479758|nr:retron St85 family effector protein [Variovorax sp. CAN15]MDN6885216.1 retron St85 family effector protein [Variovorax sp. CAN15]
MRNLFYENSAVGIRLNEFGLSLKDSPSFLSRSKQLIFLCGANQAPNTPSQRRTNLKKFIHQISPDYTVIYAEGIFNEIKKFGPQKNVLDLEHRISDVADKVIIILESESAFCELGAFAHEKLRHKLIVINNARFEHSESFINTGPIAALKEAKSPVMWYPMTSNGIKVSDGIGAIFKDLEAALTHQPADGGPVNYETLGDLRMNKISLYFLHDLVLLSGPVSYKELISCLISLFGHKSFDAASSLLAVLREAGLVTDLSTNKSTPNLPPIYEAVTTDFFLKYKYDVYALMAAFRVFHQKRSPQRFAYE